jgi:hypothetical protein
MKGFISSLLREITANSKFGSDGCYSLVFFRVFVLCGVRLK